MDYIKWELVTNGPVVLGINNKCYLFDYVDAAHFEDDARISQGVHGRKRVIQRKTAWRDCDKLSTNHAIALMGWGPCPVPPDQPEHGEECWLLKESGGTGRGTWDHNPLTMDAPEVVKASYFPKSELVGGKTRYTFYASSQDFAKDPTEENLAKINGQLPEGYEWANGQGTLDTGTTWLPFRYLDLAHSKQDLVDAGKEIFFQNIKVVDRVEEPMLEDAITIMDVGRASTLPKPHAK